MTKWLRPKPNKIKNSDQQGITTKKRKYKFCSDVKKDPPNPLELASCSSNP